MNTKQRPILKNMEDLQNFLVSELKVSNHPMSFFVGAGISMPMPSGLPSAKSVITNVIEALCIEPGLDNYRRDLPNRVLDAGMNMEVLLEIIHHNCANLNALFSMFESNEPNLYHYFLARLIEANLVKNVVTTNFDSLIEKASRVNLKVMANEPEHAMRNTRSLFKIHGTVDRPDTMIAVLQQVSRGLGLNKRQLLKDTLENTCIVIGWSDYDIDLTPSFFEAEKGKLIWFHHAPNMRKVVDFMDTSEIEVNSDKRLKHIQQILKANGGVLVSCDPLKFFLDVWRSLKEELGSIPSLESKGCKDVVSISLNWGKSLKSDERLMIVGNILRHIASWSESINLFQQVEKQLTIRAQLYNVHYQIGLCSTNLCNWNDAFNYFQLALQDKGYQPVIETLLDECPEDPELAVLYGNIGLLLKAIGRFHDAAKCKSMDLSLCEGFGLEGQSVACINYAKILFLLGKFEDAEKIAEKGTRVGIQEGNILAVSDGRSVLAAIAASKGNWIEAEVHLKSAMEICDMVGKPDLKASILHDLAGHACNISNFKIAHEYANNALEISEYYNLRDMQANIHMTIGIIHKEEATQDLPILIPYNDPHFNKSLEAYSKALELIKSRSLSNDRLKSMILNNRGLLYNLGGNYEDAYRDLSDSLQIRTELLDDLGRAIILGNLALVFLRSGGVNEAEGYLIEALTICEKFNQTMGQCQALHDLGFVYRTKLNLRRKIGEVNRTELKDLYQKAENFYTRSLKLAKQLRIPIKIRQAEKSLEILKSDWENLMFSGNARIEQAKLWHQEAIAHQQKGNLEKAQEILEKAIKVFREEKDENALGKSLNQMSQICLRQSNFKDAIKYVQESALIRTRLLENTDQKDEILQGLSIDYQQIGTLLMHSGKINEAAAYFGDSLGLALWLKNDILIASSESNLGLICWQKSDFSTAKVHFERSQEIRKRLGDRAGIARNLNHLGRIEEDMGNPKQAAQLYQESLTILRQLDPYNANIALENLKRVENRL